MVYGVVRRNGADFRAVPISAEVFCICRGYGALLSGTANAEVAGRSAPLIPDNPSP